MKIKKCTFTPNTMKSAKKCVIKCRYLNSYILRILYVYNGYSYK